MSTSDDRATAGHSLLPLLPHQKESLIMLIAIQFAEHHGLLNAEQLADARASLRSLFLRATGEETMLRRLIGMLQVNRALNRTFGELAQVLDGIRRTGESLVARHEAFKQQLASLSIAPDENAAFTGPLLEYAGGFLRAVDEFARLMQEYRDAREAEARTAHGFRLAREARDRLKQRFEQGAASESREEQQVRHKVVQSFNYAAAETEYRYARRNAERARSEIENSLQRIHRLCQLAMQPAMRSLSRTHPEDGAPGPDVYAVCAAALAKFPRLQPLQPAVQELLRLYQRSHGLFRLDFDKLNGALQPMAENAEDYFAAKEQDEDLRTQKRKLELIEALIAFIEEAALLLRNGVEYTYPKFSTAVSGRIAQAGSRWAAIADTLLHMKVAAEAELTTRLG